LRKIQQRGREGKRCKRNEDSLMGEKAGEQKVKRNRREEKGKTGDSWERVWDIRGGKKRVEREWVGRESPYNTVRR